MDKLAKVSNRGSKPGERRGGRKKGSLNKKTVETIKAVEDGGITPLDFMLQVMRDPLAETAHRHDMAKAAAPYVHARLAQVENKGEIIHRHVARLPPVEKDSASWSKQHAPTHAEPATKQ